MDLSWPSGELRMLCSAARAAQRAWPTSWEQVMFTFTLMSAAGTLAALRQFQCLEISPITPSRSNERTLMITYQATRVETSPLDIRGRRLDREPSDESAIKQLQIVDVISAGRSALTAAS